MSSDKDPRLSWSDLEFIDLLVFTLHILLFIWAFQAFQVQLLVSLRSFLAFRDFYLVVQVIYTHFSPFTCLVAFYSFYKKVKIWTSFSHLSFFLEFSLQTFHSSSVPKVLIVVRWDVNLQACSPRCKGLVKLFFGSSYSSSLNFWSLSHKIKNS